MYVCTNDCDYDSDCERGLNKEETKSIAKILRNLPSSPETYTSKLWAWQSIEFRMLKLSSIKRSLRLCSIRTLGHFLGKIP